MPPQKLRSVSRCVLHFPSPHEFLKVKFFQEVDVGLAADIGTLALLPKLTGNDSLVRELVYTARPFSAAEAKEIGLVSRVVEGGQKAVVAAALELAKVIASKSPIAVYGSKVLLSHARDHRCDPYLLPSAELMR